MSKQAAATYKRCVRCGAYRTAYGERIACECDRLDCGCFGTCESPTHEPAGEAGEQVATDVRGNGEMDFKEETT